MKSIQRTLASLGALVVMVNAVSFSDLKSTAEESAPALVSSERNTNTEITADEEDRIFGGVEAMVAKYPYMAGLHEDTLAKISVCGGTLVASQYVATAAHCIHSDSPVRYVTLGSRYTTGGLEDVEEGAERLNVAEVFVHPEFNRTDGSNDIALLRLETPSAHKPAILPTVNGSESKPGTVATLLGWGSTETTEYSEKLLSVDLDIVPNKACSEAFDDGDGAMVAAVAESQLCAGTGNGKDACAGDSGGPLLVNNTLVGLVSNGADVCGSKPGFYTRISYFLAFINDVVGGKVRGESPGGIISSSSTSSSGGSTEAPTRSHLSEFSSALPTATEKPTRAHLLKFLGEA